MFSTKLMFLTCCFRILQTVFHFIHVDLLKNVIFSWHRRRSQSDDIFFITSYSSLGCFLAEHSVLLSFTALFTVKPLHLLTPWSCFSYPFLGQSNARIEHSVKRPNMVTEMPRELRRREWFGFISLVLYCISFQTRIPILSSNFGKMLRSCLELLRCKESTGIKQDWPWSSRCTGTLASSGVPDKKLCRTWFSVLLSWRKTKHHKRQFLWGKKSTALGKVMHLDRMLPHGRVFLVRKMGYVGRAF